MSRSIALLRSLRDTHSPDVDAPMPSQRASRFRSSKLRFPRTTSSSGNSNTVALAKIKEGEIALPDKEGVMACAPKMEGPGAARMSFLGRRRHKSSRGANHLTTKGGGLISSSKPPVLADLDSASSRTTPRSASSSSYSPGTISAEAEVPRAGDGPHLLAGCDEAAFEQRLIMGLPHTPQQQQQQQAQPRLSVEQAVEGMSRHTPILRAGDCVLMDSALMHAGGANTLAPRALFHFSFKQASAYPTGRLSSLREELRGRFKLAEWRTWTRAHDASPPGRGSREQQERSRGEHDQESDA